MNNITKKYLFLFIITLSSCVDKDLDPLRQDQVQKADLLAFRATPKGMDSFDPLNIDGTESFGYVGEYLSNDPTNLTSIDIYVLKYKKVLDSNSLSGYTISVDSRILVKSIPFSDFDTTGKNYPRPTVTAIVPLKDILSKIGLDLSLESSINQLFDLYTKYDPLTESYSGSFRIETDLNLKDGSKVLASSLVSSGLFAYPTFFPAQIAYYGIIRN